MLFFTDFIFLGPGAFVPQSLLSRCSGENDSNKPTVIFVRSPSVVVRRQPVYPLVRRSFVHRPLSVSRP